MNPAAARTKALVHLPARGITGGVDWCPAGNIVSPFTRLPPPIPEAYDLSGPQIVTVSSTEPGNAPA
jgi:hypothetical protein